VKGGWPIEPTPVKPENILLIAIGVGILALAAVGVYLGGHL
jgi:hypothetical protein